MTVKEEFEWYQAQQDEIITGHLYEFVAIKDHAVIGYFHTIEDAIEGTKKYKLGTFMVHECKPREQDIIHFYNRELSFA